MLAFQGTGITIPPDHYPQHLVSRLHYDVDQFSQINSDLKRRQHDHYDSQARHITIHLMVKSFMYVKTILHPAQVKPPYL